MTSSAQTPEPTDGYRVRCVVCQQRVNHLGAELVKTNHGPGRGWRCARCGDAADDWLREMNAQGGPK